MSTPESDLGPCTEWRDASGAADGLGPDQGVEALFVNESALRRTHLFGDLRPFAQCHAPTLVARPDGRIRDANSYGNDPFPPKG